MASKVILFRILHALTFCLPSVFLPTPSSIYFLSCSKRLCRLRPLWSQRTAHHHHQTGSRASNFHWLVPGLGSQDVGDRPIGQNPCPFLNPKLQALSLSTSPTPYLSSTSSCRFVLTPIFRCQNQCCHCYQAEWLPLCLGNSAVHLCLFSVASSSLLSLHVHLSP